MQILKRLLAGKRELKHRIFVALGFMAALLLLLSSNYLNNIIEKFFFWQDKALSERLEREQALSALFFQRKPIKDSQRKDLKLQARSAISVLVTNNGEEKILFSKNSNKKLPLASLTKLMTAAVVLENYNLDRIIIVSKEAVEEEEDLGQLKVGEELSVKNLLYLLLMESSNDAAFALTEGIGKEKFLRLMQEKAKSLGMENSFFINTSGLDPDKEGQPFNYSSTEDLVKLAKYLLGEPIIIDALSRKNYPLYTPNGKFHHLLENTNELLNGSDPWVQRIIFGKTGWTPLSRGCLLLVIQAPKSKGILINVVLGSPDRFEEMKKLINWLEESYIW